MKSLAGIAALVVVLSGLAGATLAGTLDPNLENVMNAAGDQEPISVLVFLRDAGNIKELNQELNRTRANRQVRHETVVRALQDTASQTQRPVLAHLESLTGRGNVTSFYPYWVDNSIHMVATKAAIKEIAERDDIEMVYYDYEIELIRPIHSDNPPPPADPQTPENGLIAVRAPEVWAMGFDGTGVLTSSLDTGVDGNHPALHNRWRGFDPRYAGHPQWAWFDPQTQTTFPQAFADHGTHTMGTILGGAPGDQVGVAPGAQWIHAAVIDRVSIPVTVAQAKLAFQWLIDPDGDPATVWDVPTSNSNSWGLSTSLGYPPCDTGFWSYIDNCEAAGIVVVFAAGNEGPTTQTIRRPADRGTTELNSFSVAAVDGHTAGWPIADFSSRGPSHCTPGGGIVIKPEVSAPGVNVRSSIPGGGYDGSWSGTSMATPHVNGVIVLIRQACPDLSVDEVKQILLDTAHDLGTAGNDNNYGYGMVDAVEAVNMALAMCSGAPHAFDSSLQTPVNTALTVALQATDYDHLPNPPGLIMYLVTSLPLAGNTVTDAGNGHLIDASELPYTLVNNGDQVVFTPATDYYGTDTFQFKANDGGTPPDGGDSNIATVSVLVLYPAPSIATSALPMGVRYSPYGPFQLEAVGGQPPLTWSVVPTPPSGLTFTSNGVLSGTPTVNGSFNLSFRATDSLSRLATRTIPLVINLEPQPPHAQAQSVTTPVNTTAPITLVALDDGLPGGPLTYRITSLPTHGTLLAPGVGAIHTVPFVLAGNGHAVSYTPNWWYLGSDTFAFTADDGGTAPAGGESAPATVTVTVPVPPLQLIHGFPLDEDPGWTTEGQWAFGTPLGEGSHHFDPTGAHTGVNVYGYNLSGDYTNNMPQYNLTTTALDCTWVLHGQLKFWKWLGVEAYDQATVQVSNDGTNWTTVWANPTATVFNDAAWSQMTLDISAVADAQPAVYIRWTMGPTDYSVTYPGWNLDDIEVWGVVFAAPPGCRGDANCDGQVGFADIDYFVAGIPDNEAAWTAYYAGQNGGSLPTCAFSNCDITGDGHVNFADIDPFVALIPSACP